MPSPELSILVPTYNEADIIEGTLREIASALGSSLASKTEVLVVDDGRDNLPEVVRNAAPGLGFARVEALRNSPPLGKGQSLAVGFARARGRIAGFLDADLSTPPSYINEAYDALDADRCDVFIGSRQAQDSKVTREQSIVKDWLGDGLKLVVNGLIFTGGRKYWDTQCGFKFFKNDVAKVLYHNLVAPDGMTDIEILVRANMLRYRVLEKGVKWMDVRESKRSLGRILWGDLKSVAGIVWHYRVFGGEQLRKLKPSAKNH